MNDFVKLDMFVNSLPCGHAPEVEDDRIILDQCFECGWMTPYRKQANLVNSAAANRGQSDTDLVKWVHASRIGEIGIDNDAMTKLFELAIRCSLRFGREEALRAELSQIAEEEGKG
jgi:hypothetical protein